MRDRHTRRQRRSNTIKTNTEFVVFKFFFFFSRSIPHERKRKGTRRIRRPARGADKFSATDCPDGGAVEKKNGARVTDARTYTDTMNCVMAGNSCARCADAAAAAVVAAAAAAQPKRSRIHTPRTRPPCFSQRFSRTAVGRVDFSIGNLSPGPTVRSPTVKSAGNTVKSPFGDGYCSRPVAVPLRTPACSSAAQRLGHATTPSARGRRDKRPRNRSAGRKYTIIIIITIP